MKNKRLAFRFADGFAPASLLVGQIQRRAKFVTITSEENKMRNRQRPTLINPAGAPLKLRLPDFPILFEVYSQRFVFQTQICNKIVREIIWLLACLVVNSRSSGISFVGEGPLLSYIKQATNSTVNQPVPGSKIVESSKLKKARTQK